MYVVEISPPTMEGSIACLKRVLVPDKIYLNLLRAEVDAMKKLQGHPNVVRYIDSHAARTHSDAGQQATQAHAYEVFLLMEYCSGHGLIDFMNQRLQNMLTESEILKIMAEVTYGLSAMHYLQPALIHRDLKIENILISGDGTCKLCDFGSVSPVLRPPRNQTEFRILEEDIQCHTTAQYRSPEMIDIYRGFPINEKSDMWALGVFLYKLCYYTTPFEKEGQLAILHARYSFPPKPAFSSRLKNIIRALLQEDPRARPNVYQVLKEVCSMRGLEVPIKDIYVQQTTPPDQLYGPSADTSGIVKAPPTIPPKQSIPDIKPMYRGRPPRTTSSAKSLPELVSIGTDTEDKDELRLGLESSKISTDPGVHLSQIGAASKSDNLSKSEPERDIFEFLDKEQSLSAKVGKALKENSPALSAKTGESVDLAHKTPHMDPIEVLYDEDEQNKSAAASPFRPHSQPKDTAGAPAAAEEDDINARFPSLEQLEVALPRPVAREQIQKPAKPQPMINPPQGQLIIQQTKEELISVTSPPIVHPKATKPIIVAKNERQKPEVVAQKPAHLQPRPDILGISPTQPQSRTVPQPPQHQHRYSFDERFSSSSSDSLNSDRHPTLRPPPQTYQHQQQAQSSPNSKKNPNHPYNRQPPQPPRHSRPVSMYSRSNSGEYFDQPMARERSKEELNAGVQQKPEQSERTELKRILSHISNADNMVSVDLEEDSQHIDSNVDFLKTLDTSDNGTPHYHRRPSHNHNRERERERDQERQRSFEISRDREWEREKELEREREIERDRERERERERERRRQSGSYERKSGTFERNGNERTSYDRPRPEIKRGTSNKHLKRASLSLIPNILRKGSNSNSCNQGTRAQSTSSSDEDLAAAIAADRRLETSSDVGLSESPDIELRLPQTSRTMPLPRRAKKTAMIQNRMQQLLERRHSPPPRRTAMGYGKYTETVVSEGEDRRLGIGESSHGFEAAQQPARRSFNEGIRADERRSFEESLMHRNTVEKEVEKNLKDSADKARERQWQREQQHKKEASQSLGRKELDSTTDLVDLTSEDGGKIIRTISASSRASASSKKGGARPGIPEKPAHLQKSPGRRSSTKDEWASNFNQKYPSLTH